MSISYNPPIKFILDLDNLTTAVQSSLLQTYTPTEAINIEIDIDNNQLILSKPGLTLETKITVKKWYS